MEMAASRLYSEKFLLNSLYRAAICKNADDFVRFQVDQINQNIPKFQSDFLTVNILHLNKKFMLDGEITSAVAHNSQNTINSYQRSLIHDEFTPISFLNAGTAMFNTAFRPMDDWIDQPIYRLHCTPYDHHWVLAVSYRFPHHKTTFIAFHYMRAKGTGFSEELSEEFVEYISYPFYLAWLHIYGAICADTLYEWLSLCAGMTEPRFHVVRAIAGQGLSNTQILAKNFGVSRSGIDKHITNSNEILLSQQPELQLSGSHNNNRTLAIGKAYLFFQFGAGAVLRNLPRRPSQG